MKRERENMKTLQELVDSHERIVFFGGAGVSTESGIPDYRSRDGIYSRGYTLPAETLLSHTYFMQHTQEFYDFYRDVMVHPQAKPNAAHTALAKLEEAGRLLSVVTQNIDGLHRAAGSKHVHRLHGCVYENYCMDCGKSYPLSVILQTRGVPKCDCGGVIRPNVVLYEESLDERTLREAVEDLSRADMLIVGGTSLNVYPAAGLLSYFQGDAVVVINLQPTAFDRNADLVLTQPIAKTLGALNIHSVGGK